MDNPLRIPTFHDPDEVAHTLMMLLRAGTRHPALAPHTQELHPGLPLDVFNAAADLAWSRLTDEERRMAAEETSR